MSEQRKKILEMLVSGKINAEEADKLLSALDSNQSKEEHESFADVKDFKDFNETKDIKKPKFLHVKVEKEPGTGNRHDNVDIKIPILLLKAGMKLGSMIPEGSKDEINSHLSSKGIHLDLNSIDSKDLDVILNSLSETSININTDKEKVQIYCE